MSQAVTQARTYDDFTGPELDTGRWFYLEYPPGPDGVSWRCEEPSARTEVGDGTLNVHVERFERGHDQVQIMDNPKHLLLSTESFPVPAGGRASFSLQLAATSRNAAPRDYRDGFASFNVLDLSSGMVFDLCATSDQVFAIYERLPVPGVEAPFTHVIDSPLAGIETAAGRPHHCEVTLDAAQRSAEWRVDGALVFEVRDVLVPDEVKLGVGLITLHPIADGTSRSVRGQGLSASFGPIQVTATP
ncbi:MAG: hypothetical protein GEV09_06540 [Pseudonocardiaceae bacterium]|nr:hypothetical protein [Pseudonocardiaceae bacterium]